MEDFNEAKILAMISSIDIEISLLGCTILIKGGKEKVVNFFEKYGVYRGFEMIPEALKYVIRVQGLRVESMVVNCGDFQIHITNHVWVRLDGNIEPYLKSSSRIIYL